MLTVNCMKSLRLIIPLFLFYFVAACTRTDSATATSNVYNAFENASRQTSAKTFREDNWTIVSTTENGDSVYWFLAPDINKVSPAIFKKTIRVKHKNAQEAVIVSQCDAPKQACDDIMKKFEILSDKYK